MKNHGLWLLGCVLAASCGAASDEAGDDPSVEGVLRGVADRGRHPAVVALSLGDGALCSGTLVSPRAVLTARHCVSVTQEEIACERPGRQVLGDRDPRAITVIAGDDARDGVAVARGLRLVTLGGDRLCGADVALLVLDREVRGIAPLAVSRRRVAAGDAVSIAGFGRRGDSARAGVGVRYFRDRVDVLEASAAEFISTAGSCAGDSGGPALDRRTGEVVGVVSRGGARCAAGDSVWSQASLAAPLLDALR